MVSMAWNHSLVRVTVRLTVKTELQIETFNLSLSTLLEQRIKYISTST